MRPCRRRTHSRPRRVARATRARRRAHACPPAIAAPGEPEQLDELVELLRELVSDTPRGGAFYQVQFRDRPGDFIRAALASCGIDRPTAAQLDEYMHLVAGGRFNSDLHGTYSSSIIYPDRWLVPGLRMGIRTAWLPRNEDALDLYLRGGSPQCAVDRRTGVALTPATSLGLVWAPPVELVAGELTTETFSWDDGSSTLDPPAPFLVPRK